MFNKDKEEVKEVRIKVKVLKPFRYSFSNTLQKVAKEGDKITITIKSVFNGLKKEGFVKED